MTNSYDYQGDFCKKPCECSQSAYQFANISTPIEICPEASVGCIETECCGEPYIECECEPCGASLNLVITQKIKVKIPVTVGIRTIEGNSYIQCDNGCCD